jgi:hypothetical protein
MSSMPPRIAYALGVPYSSSSRTGQGDAATNWNCGDRDARSVTQALIEGAHRVLVKIVGGGRKHETQCA